MSKTKAPAPKKSQDYGNSEDEAIDLSAALYKKWGEDEDNAPLISREWRTSMISKMRSGDIDGMKRDAAPWAQLKAMDLMMNAEKEETQLRAAEFVLGQSGHGEIKQVQHMVEYETMPVDQLGAMVASKIQRLQKVVPGLASILHLTPNADGILEVDSKEGLKG